MLGNSINALTALAVLGGIPHAVKLDHPTVAVGHAAFERADELLATYVDLADGLAFAKRGVVSLLSGVHTLPGRRCGLRRVSSSSAPVHGHENGLQKHANKPRNERLGLALPPHLFLPYIE